ncbi:MAG: response regulator [Microcystaceae cyanobacterium]
MLNPDIRDQAYQFFIEEAPELLQMIESGLLTLKEERNTQTVHEIMRAAHSIKGGAASVELDHIKTLAHRLEDIFKALYDDSVVIDTELETLLLQGYDCLRNPLEEQMATGEHDGEAAIANAEQVWQKIEAQLGDSLANTEQYIPSSADLGVDIVSSLFEVDVTQGIEQLAKIAEHPNDYDIMSELQTQMEVFGGFAEMLGLPGFGEITEATLKALELNPDQDHYILQLALVDLIEAREQVLEKGDRTSGGSPSAALLGFTTQEEKTVENNNGSASEWDDGNVLGFDNLFEATPEQELSEESGWTEIDTLTAPHLGGNFNLFSEEAAKAEEFPALDDVFGEQLDFDTIDNQAAETIAENSELEDIFASEPPPLENVFAPNVEVQEPSEMMDLEGQSPELEAVFNIELGTENEVIHSDVTEEHPELEDVFNIELGTENEVIHSDVTEEHPELEDVFNIELGTENEVIHSENQPLEEGLSPENLADISLEESDAITEETLQDLSDPDLENVFGIVSEQVDEHLFDIEGENKVSSEPINPSLEAVFGVDDSLTEETLEPEIKSEEIPEFDIDPSRLIDTEAKTIEDIFAVSNLEDNENLFTIPAETQETNESIMDESVSQDDDIDRSIDPEVSTLESLFEAGESQENDNLFTISEETSEKKDELVTQEKENTSNPSSRFKKSDVPTLEDIFEVAGSEDDKDVFTIPAETQETELIASDTPSLDDVFGSVVDSALPIEEKQPNVKENKKDTSEQIDNAIAEVENLFDSLPPLEEIESSPIINAEPQKRKAVKPQPQFKPRSSSTSRPKTQSKSNKKQKAAPTPSTSNLSIKVDFERLERMNNLVGELMINRNSLSLQNDQMQGSVKSLLNRFVTFQAMIGQLQELSDQMLIAPEKLDSQRVNPNQIQDISRGLGNFDSLEMDTYSTLYSLLGMLLEEMIQLEESVDDVVLFARTSNQTLEQQRQMLTNLRDELMWARMLPLGEVLNRFPRLLRDLSATYGKPVRLKLTGTAVLVDKAALEKLYDPLLHLVRNGFDHGIESPEERKQVGKPAEGQIEIRAYHQGNQTIVEICDDGRGLNYDKIKAKAIQTGLITQEQATVVSKERIENLIFEPAFSTAAQVSELSGRGVGLDVVRSQLRALKGTVMVTSKQGRGTIFTLKLPLTLTIAKLLVCQVAYENSNSRVSVAFPSDTIEEILVPEANQIKISGNQRFLLWQGHIIPIYPVKDLLQYNCPLPESFADKGFNVAIPDEWGLPLLLLRRGDQLYGLEVSRLETEQELVIKSFGNAVSAPTYTYGCTILGDGQLIPVVNGATLIEQSLAPNYSTTPSSVTQTVVRDDAEGLSTPSVDEFKPQVTTRQAPLMLVVDDSAALRRTLALTLEKAGYRVVQARDGREALEQLQHTSGINMVICDIEMPNMNGFEFLGQRRRDPEMMSIPVAMLTSRSNDKHRQLAMTLGASAYFTKPYIEQQFLTSVANILEENRVSVSS